MTRYTPNPTIRVLLLGAEGVGKNCIESRFTTKLYPPPYNPALTLNSRRFLTLAPAPDDSQCGQKYEELERHGEKDEKDTENKRTKMAVSGDKTVAASASERTPTSKSNSAASAASAASATYAHDTQSLDLDERTLVNSEGTCSACVRENSTYLVEVINYPALHKSVHARKQVHSKADYDAVLLVYDVCNRASFDAVKTLHAEIPVCTRKNHHSHHRKAAHHASTTRSRTTGWFGGGGNDLTGRTGSGEIVVGLIGNKSDVDGERPIDIGSGLGLAAVKESKDEREDIVRGSLMSPLYYESIMYAELMAGLERRKAAASSDLPKRPDLLTSQSANMQQLDEASKENDIQKWLQISRLESAPEPVGREEPESAGSHTQRPENIPSAADHRSREVSSSDGEALAHQLRLAVPFQETSARSGENIEQVFESVVSEVLREMGRDAGGTNKASKTCRHKANLVKVKTGESQESANHHCRQILEQETEEGHGAKAQAQTQARALAPTVSKSTVITISTDGEPAGAAMLSEVDKAAVSLQGFTSDASIPGRSRVGRMRRLFMRNGANIAV
ncbi:hypothetical protein F503_02627 [Ophiostoma piceae UAMH 11346]|uniref:Ras family protein n=1 Tax=Ophiostoma piceae (strain UAMH 11346) TaxID=1262450 RepID=S3BYZ5_OPHP1|nr:hypothetical protein F503_02627 [Ophiostoma piceae UAMH 11346]